MNLFREAVMRFPGVIGKLSLFLVLFLATGVISASAQEDNLKEFPMRFAILGDRTGGHVPGIYGQVVKEVERMRPDFVMNVGDMIEGYTADTMVLISEWNEYDSLLQGLSRPIYRTPGNHDITMDEMLELYRRYCGEPVYSFTRRGVHFIIMDNSRIEKVEDFDKEQLDWLVDDLKKNQDVLYTMVFFHKPFWSKTLAYGKPDSLHDIFVKYGVDAVFSGHFHTYFSGLYDGIKYTAVGSSGGDTETGLTGIKFHFAWVTVDGEGIHIAPILYQAVRAWDEVSAAENEFAYVKGSQVISFASPLLVDNELKPLGGMVSARIWNPNSEETLSDTLVWDVPSGWTIEPSRMAVTIPPLDSTTVNFRVMMDAPLYPAPEASLNYPYAVGKYTSTQKGLAVQRTAFCVRAEKKPKIDGKIGEGEWAEPVSKFFSPDGGPATTDGVDFYFSYDDKNLYLGAYCKESRPDSIMAAITEHDGAIYGEDCVGYFFYPGKDTVYQIYINPNGAVFDQAIFRNENGEMESIREWDGKYEVKTARGEGFWSVEAAVPLAQLNAMIKEGDEWGLNFRRKQRRLGTSSDWMIPIEYDPELLGKLIAK